MPITPRPRRISSVADVSTPFDVTLAVPATAEDVVAVPVGSQGRVVSLINEGPGTIAIAFDATAIVDDLLLEEGDAYDEHDLDFSTNISFINVTTGQTPRVHGIIWSGAPV